jgi:uncharacterized membrane protein YbaN (DUF454 family)
MVRKVAALIAGSVLVVVGIMGLFLPIVQGIACIVAGLALLGYASPKVRETLEPVLKRCERCVRELRDRVSRRLRRK